MRQKNRYQPGSDSLFKLSRSKLENFLSCPRCFYLDRRLGIEPPSGPPFTLNSAVDYLLKKEFDHYRALGEPHPYMLQNSIDAIPLTDSRLDQWRSNFKGVRVQHFASGFEFSGAVDDLWIDCETHEVIVVDYKATAKDNEVSLDADWQISYKRQMEIYQWLLRRSGLKISDTGYFVYCNGDRSRESFDGTMRFKVSIIAYTGSDSWVEHALMDAKLCLNGDLPEPSQDCEQCAYLSDVRQLGL